MLLCVCLLLLTAVAETDFLPFSPHNSVSLVPFVSFVPFVPMS